MALTSDDITQIRYIVRDEVKQTFREQLRQAIREETPAAAERGMQAIKAQLAHLEQKIETLEQTILKRLP